MSAQRYHRDAGRNPREPLLNEQLARRAVEILQDGKRHNLEVVIADLAGLIPPGVAVRQNEKDRRYSTGGSGQRHSKDRVPPRRLQRDPAALIRSGKRTIIRAVLNSSVAFETSAGTVRLVGLPRVVRGDRIRQQYIQPVLEGLAQSLHAAKLDEAVEHVRVEAHDNGFHLHLCPNGCTLGGPRHDTDDLEN